MAEDKVTNLYNAFVKNGYAMEPEAQFRENLKDPKKRKAAYDALVADGYNMEPFADFESNIGFGAPTPAPAPTAPTPQQQAQPAATGMSYQMHTMLNDFNQKSKERIGQIQRLSEPLTPEGRQKRRALEFQAQLAGSPTKVLGLTPRTNATVPDGEQGGVVEGAAQQQPEQSGQSPVPYGVKYIDGKPVTQWLLPDGRLTTSLMEADQAEYGARTARQATSISFQIQKAETELAELQKQYEDSKSRVQEEWAEEHKRNKAPLAAVLASRTYVPRQHGDKGNSALLVAIRQKEEQIKDLIEERDRQSGKDVGFWRGFGRIVSDFRTWDLGMGDLSDAMTMLNAKHYSSPKATEDERKAGEAMMKALYDRQETENLYGGNTSWWNRAGGMTGHMPAFILDFALTGGGYGSVAKVGAKTAAKQSVKLFGKRAIEEMAGLGVKEYAKQYGVRGVGRMAGNWTVKALGTTTDDLLVRAPLMANTIQGGKTAADIIDRKLGDVVIDENGNYDFSNDKTWGSAVWQGEANSIIENYSEMFGSHIDGLTPMLAKTFGGKRISGMLARANASGFGQVLNTTRKQFQHLGVSDYIGEVAEEYYGQLWRTMLNLDDAYTDVPIFDEQGNPMIDEHGNPVTGRKNLLFTGQFHGDIWGGMALSMGLMGAGKYTLTGVGYANMKREVNKVDRMASQVLGHDEWEVLRETIDNTTNEDMGALAENVINDSSLSEEERAAVMVYMERSLNLRGLNLATLAKNRGAETDGPVTLEDVYQPNPHTDGETSSHFTPEQADAQRLYSEGRELFGRFEEGDPTVQADVDAIALRMQEAYQAVEDAFGAEAEYYMFHVNENPWALVNDPELTAEQQDAVLYYINAKAALDGVMDASNEVADRKRAEVEQSVGKRTHKDNGIIIPATMKVDDRQVYVVKGDVVMFPDGSAVDVRNSSESVVVMDAQTGEYEFTSPDQIFKVSEAVNPQDELDTALSVIEQEQMSVFGQNAIAPEEPAEGEAPIDQSADVSPEPAPETASTEEYDRGYEQGLEEAAKADDAWVANLIKIYSQNTPESMPETMKGRLDAFLYEQQRRAQSVPEMPENVPNPTENSVSDAEIAPETVSSVENGQQTALSRIPLNEQGEPRFEAVDKDTAWDGLVEAVGGETDAVDIAMAQVQQASTDLEALKKKPPTLKAPKLKGSPMAMAQAKRKAAEQYQNDLALYNQQIAEAQARIDAWNGIVAVHNTRKAELRRQQEEERRQRDAIAHDKAVARFEEEQRIKAEKQAEQERIGVHAVNPKIKEKWDAAPKVEGNEDALTLPDGSTISGRYVLTEAGAASPSHDANNGYVPTEGFPIDENGQSVNDRDYFRDKDAQQKVEGMASSYDNRALQDPVIVSKDGVVMSGNNRTMSGDIAARRGTDKAYVDYLAQFGHRKYGFTSEQVTGMKNPRVVFVPDEALPYDATTFARFNAQEKKSQGKPEAAVKLGKIVPDNVFNVIVNDISRYDRLSDYYADEKAAGNNKMEHRRVDGYNISIENAKGSVRRGTGADGKPWETTMQNDYGYIRGTEGVDGDHIDVFLSDTPEEGDVFVVDQVNEDGSFDEHKVMYGFPTEQAARYAYLSNYEPGWTGLGAITHVSKEEFKKWIQSSRRKTKPFAEYKSVKAIEGNGMIGRSLTEQEATELIARMEATAEVAPSIELTPENWIAQFGEDDTVETPIGIVKMGANQLLKLYSLKRTEYFSMIHPTLNSPDVILEEADPKEGSERDSKYLFIKTFVKSDGTRIVHFESVTVKKDGMEVSISSHEIKDKSLKNKMQNDIVLHLDEKLSPSSEMRLTETPSESEGPDLVPTSDNVSSDGKDNTLSADKQTNGAESSEPYTITPTTYTNKKGKTSDVHLVKFNRELTKEEKSALDTFVREPLAEGKKTSRGWYDRKQGGYMMRSEEAARQLAEMIGNEEAVADAQPMTAEELREAVGASRTRNPRPKKSPINRVSLEDVMTDLSTKGETKLSDHAEPVKAEPEAQHEISDDEMQSLANELRELLGIGDDEGDTNIKFRDPGELTAQERQRTQSAGIRFAMGLIERGTTAFPDYATKMVGLLGDKIRPWLKSFYEGARWTPGYEKYAFTPTEQVAVFDVQNFDKKQADPIAQAAMIVEERKASTASVQAQKELTETRNKNRRENDKQREADTAALAEKAEAVAGEAESIAETSADAGELNRASELIDQTLDEINDQLAVLGYYEAVEDDSKFHESYGYMLTAEKKAVADATKLAKQLVNDLGIDIKVTSATTLGRKRVKKGTAVRANIAPAGGDVIVNLPLNEGRILAIYIGLEPVAERGTRRRGDNLAVERILYRVENPNGSGMERWGYNMYAPVESTYADFLRRVKEITRDYLPKEKSVDELWHEWSDMAERGESPYTITPEVEAQLAEERKVDVTHNGYKVGDEVMWDRYGNGNWEKVKIEDFDTDGGPIFEAVKDVMSEKGDWSRVKPADGIFGEAKRVARAAQEKKRSSRKKDVTLKPEQPVGDLFGGLFDNTQNSSNHEETDVQPRPGTAERERGHEPQSHEPLGESQRNEVKGTDGRGMGGRSSVNPMSDGERGAGVPRKPKSQPVIEPVPESERKNVRNNHAERGVDYAPKGEDARIKANMEAIELAKRLLDAGETATPEQMAVLRKFSGWGGLGKAFNEQGYTPNPIAKRLKELLGEDGYQDAVDSRRSAYYTPAEVIDTMWDVARAMGFKGGNVLEGSAGIGNIIGLMPTDMSERSSIHAVEIDRTTGGILSLLYPDAKVEIQGFEKTRVQNGTVDLAITNVPFITGAKVFDETGDKDLSKKFHDIHDFCIAKNIRKLREGGIGIFITSSGTMDNSKELRLWIIGEGNADVVGAFRMHNKTFGGTGATSDIIVVRKRVNGKPSPNAIDVTDAIGVRVADYDTGDTRKVKGQEIPVIKQYSMMYNKYFAEHPENMAGEMMFNFERGETRFPTSRALFPVKEKEQSKMLSEWASSFADMEEEATAAPKVEDEITRINEQLGEGVKEGSMVLNSQGELCMARMGEAVPLGLNKNKVKGHTKAECFKAYSAIKKALSDVLEYQSSNEGDEGLAPLLKELNRAFDTFTRTYGNLHKNTAISFLRNDVDFSSILALETYSEKGDKKGNKVVKVGKTDIFSHRVIDTEKEPQPTTIKDAILASLYKSGGVDVEYIGQALGKPTEEVKREIVSSGLGFENPSTGTMEVSYKYLSGNVREKLHIAQENNADGRYDANIKALEGVMPMTIPAHLIEFSLGSSWIEPKLYEDFVFEKTGLRVTLTNAGGTWFMKTPWSTFNEKNRAMAVVSKMCDKTIMGHELIEAAITNRQITVSKTEKHYDGSTETITDKAATAECGTKVDEIRAEFKDWAREHMQADPAMSARIEQTYNDQFNNYVPMSIPDEFVPQHFGGQVSELQGDPFALRPHQGRAVVRGTTEPILLAHEVGTGKTYTLITTAMEMRRLGTARKPMIVVQNATVGQFVESAKEIYPNAKVLTIEEADRTAEGRKNFYAKIKYNDWDMIVVPQSVFERIPDSEEREMAYVKDIIEEKMKVLEAMREADSDGRSLIVRQAERELAEQEARLAELTETMQGKKKKRDEKREATTRQNAEVRALEMLDREVDDVENFDDMGIDAILVDEAHEYKHLGFATAMQRGVKGVDPSYSKKSQGVFLKAQAVMERNNGRNVVFATGTPISNTAAEIWTFMRYLMPVDTMKSYGIYYFDDFVRNFGNIAQMVEFSTNGKFKENNRFAGYVNLPELVRIWSSVADTVLTREAGGVSDKIPDMEGGKPQDIYLPQTRALRSVMKYVKAELDRYDKMTGKEKKENSHIPLTMYGIAKAAAVDVRLVVPNAEDDPNSKTNATVRETLRSLRDSEKYKGTVAIFSDNYQNKQSGFNLYEDIRKKLIAEGVPAEQIVVIKPGMTVKRKLDIFEKVNAGEIRVIMGSTFTLGTGVNIQERLHTLIHVDAPNRPMDYTQRNGRALRQGNLHKDMDIPVRIIRFGVEDSLDVTAYQRLKTKGAIADSIMNGSKMMQNSMENRVLEEEEDSFGDMTAQLSGSEYAILKNQAEREVRNLTAKQKGHDLDQIYVHNQLPKVEGFIKGAERRIEIETKNLEIIGSHFPDGTIKKITIGKLTFDSVAAMDDFFKEQNAKMNEAAENVREGADNYTSKLVVDVDGLKFEVTTTVSRTVDSKGQGTLTFEPERNVTYSCEELGIKDQAIKGNRLKNIMQKIAEDIVTGRESRELLSRGQQQLAHYTEERTQLEQRNGREFPHKQELAEAKERLAKYEEAMKKELAEKEAKYAELDKSVETASDITLTDEDSTDTPTTGDGNKYRLVAERELLDFLDAQPLKKGYRYSQWANMGVLPPMTAKQNGEWRAPMIFSRWEQSEEGMRKENGKADLVQGNGRTTGDVAYNPYFHIRTSPLNDQFTAAYDRPELLVVEGYYPESEETSGYQAEGAKDSVGLMDWHSGSVNGQLSDDTKVQTMLSRYFKPGRIVPWSEVADLIMERVGNQKITFPINAVPPMLRAELAKRGAKFGDISGSVAEADIPMLNELRDRVNAGEWDAGLEKARAYLDAYESSTEAKEARVADLSARANTPVRIVRTQEEADALPTRRERRAKGWWSAKDDEVVIVLPNNVNVADVDNTFVHEVAGHKGLRALVGEERFDEFLGEIYDHASNPIRKVIDKMTDRMVSEEADRLRTRKAQAHERAGKDVNANYYTDMAEARVEAEAKRKDFRKEATEEYMADLAGRIGSEGFEKMSRDELTLWGKIKAKVQSFLDKFLSGLKIAKSIRLNDKDLSYILFKSWKNMRDKQGKGGVFADAEDAVMRHRTGWGEAMLSESAKIEDANNRFNKELQRQVDGNLPDGHIYQLGMPSNILRSTGVPNLPIQMSATRLRAKATEYGHDFDLAEIRNLVKELQTPMAVFAYGNKGKMQNIIVGIESNGKQFIVGLSLNPIVNGKALEINSVRNVFPKHNAEWLNWISQGKLLYADKQKIQALIDKQRTILADVDYLDLEDVAKVIKTFENPTFDGDEDVRFRDGADYVERVPVMARAMYEKQIQSSMYQFTEAMQDSMRGLMEFYKAVESQGAKRDIEDVSSFENAYIAENLMSSKSHAEMDEYEHRILRPLLDIAARMSGDKRGREELLDYMMAKHGLERNAYMRNEAIANGEESERDFAGLCGLTGETDWQNAEIVAQQMVDDYEAAHSTDIPALWSAVNKATKTSLQKIYNCGLISKAQYEKIRDMYNFYIPLQGFDEKTSDDVYGYLTSKKGAFSSPIKKAEGRKSKADDPLATIAYMAQNSIIQGNRNVMKQKFLTYVQNHPSDLASVNKLWLVHDEITDTWKPVFADVDENMTPDEIDKVVMDFEERMESLSQSEPDKYKRGRDAIGIPYRIVDGNIKEHQVVVKRNGESYVITINGNPRAAQAVNGLTNPDNDLNGAIGKVFNIASTVNRELSQLYTTRNPDFVVSNFIRDLIYSNTMVHVKENQGYAMRFHKNHAKVNPIRMVELLHLYEANKLDMRNPMHRMFYEFMHWGGETGYTLQRNLEQEKKLVSKIMKEARRGQLNPMSILGLIGNNLDQINRAVENSARFAAFITSREVGRDVQRSAYDAKEISVNFNKKGAGSKFMDATGQTFAGKAAGFTSGLGRSFYVFWNAAIQGTANFGKAFRKHPVKSITAATSLLLLGYIMALLADDGDDEDKNGYYNVPKYTRRSNLMFRFGEQWLTIPLPVEYRAIYGLGELAYSVTSGREEYSDAELAKETASQLSQLLPLDFMEGGGGLHAFVPSAFKPMVETATNTSWTGLPIYKNTPFNKNMPEWTKAYPRTNTQLVELSRWANEASGGNNYAAGWANFNPAQLEYLLNGYFGGYSNVINKMVKTGETMLGEREYDPSSILLVNRLVKMGDERTAEKKINSDFFKYLEEYRRTHTLLRKYEDEAERGSDRYSIFLDALKHSRDGARHDVMDEYITDYNWLNRATKDSEIADEERATYEEEMRRLKREVVSLMKVAHDSVQVNKMKERFAEEYIQQ